MESCLITGRNDSSEIFFGTHPGQLRHGHANSCGLPPEDGHVLFC